MSRHQSAEEIPVKGQLTET